eukprot:GHRQ01013170.1.p1 GENE.GHRQ01013170.1~~GHRQ01013170.1.p1  ORF type:complete len:344 (+),score=111.83 GHRQ01013170.1:127-1158(+)
MTTAEAASEAAAIAPPAAPPRHLYLTGLQHHCRAVRVLHMGLVFELMLLRSAALFKRELLAAAGVVLLASRVLDCSVALLLGLLFGCLQLWCWCNAAQRVEYIRGHRAGAHGYDGQYCENTIEALQALIEEDNGPHGPVKDLHYIELDVQETADGELVVLHDFDLLRAFPNTGLNVAGYEQLALPGLKPAPELIQVQDVTSSQLCALHVAGREGLHAPTLREFIAAFRAASCRRPLVVEVKKVFSDGGRTMLLQLLREHKPYADRLELEHPGMRNPHLGFLALIAFPHFYVKCFGEFGSQRWRHWSQQFASAGIPVRCCYLETLSYCHGLPPNQGQKEEQTSG